MNLKKGLAIQFILAIMVSFFFNTSYSKGVIYQYKANPEEFYDSSFYDQDNRYIEDGQLNLSFSQPVFKLSDIDAMTNEIQKKIKLKITPAAAGDFKPIGTQQAAFTFRQKLKPSTHYVVQINAPEIKSTEGKPVNVTINYRQLQNNKYEFTTRRLEMESCTIMGEGLGDPIYLTFNMPVDDKNLKPQMQIKQGFLGKLDFTVFPTFYTNLIQSNGTTYGFIYTNTRTVKIVTLQRKADTKYTIEIKKNFLPVNGELGMVRDYQYSFQTYAPLRFIEISDNNYDEKNRKQFFSDSTLYFRFNNSLDQRVKLKNLITVTPPVKNLKCEYDDKTINVTGDFSGGEDYQFIISGNVKDRYSQTLEKSVSERISIDHAVSILGMPSGYMVMENYLPMILPFKIRNLDSVQLYYQTFQTKEDIARFILQRPAADDSQFTGSAQLKEIQVKDGWDKYFNYRLDIGRLTKQKPVFMAYLASSEKKVSRNDSPSIRRAGMILFTDMGLTVKSGPAQTVAYVRGLKDNQPVAGASVYEIIAQNGSDPEIVFRGKTDEQGVCSFKGNYPMPFLMVEKEGKFCINYGKNKYSYEYNEDSEDVSYDYASLFYDNKNKNSIINSANSYSYKEPSAMLFSERFLYKPGETAQLKGIIRYRWNDSWNTLTENGEVRNISFKVDNSRGENITNITVTPDEWGSFSFAVQLEEKAPTGYYSIHSDKDNVYASFSVQDFKPAKAEMRVMPRKNEYAWGDTFEADLLGWYLFGAPVVKPIQYEVTLQPYAYSSAKYPEYSFSVPLNNPNQTRRDYGFTLFSGTTTPDSSGKLTIRQAIKNDNFFGDASLMVSANAELDDKSRIYGNRADLTVLNPVHVGMSLSTYFVEQNKEFKVRLIAIDNKGAVVEGQEITLSIIKEEWKSYQKAGVNGRLEWHSEVTRKNILQKQMTAGKTEFPLTVNEPGYYMVQAVSKARGHDMVSESYFYVLGPGYVGWSMDNSYAISLESDKPKYQVGDTAMILVKNPFKSAHALITTEREKIYEIQQMDITNSMAMIPIKITRENIPNIFVSVMLFSGRTGTNQVKNDVDVARPSYRMGYINLPVYLTEKELKITVIPAQEHYGPGEKADVSFEVKDYLGNLVPEAELTVAAADKGVLNLVNYQLPNPMDHFYGSRPLAVYTSEMRELIYGQRYLSEKGEVVGGDGLADESAGMGMIIPRMNFRYTSFYTNAIIVKNGKADVSFTIPDNLTTWKVMAVSQTKDSCFGYGEGQFAVKRPLMVLSTLPRMVRNLDTVEAGAMIYNYTGASGEVKVSLECDRPMEFLSSKTTNITIDNNQSKEVKFAFHVPVMAAAEAKFTLKAKLGSISDGVQETSWIRNPVVLETTAVYEKTTGKADEKIEITPNVIPELSKLELNLSPTAFNELTGCVDYLVHYPYGCLEQKTSSILPLILGGDIIIKYGLLKDKTGEDLRKTVQTILDEMPKYIGEDGFKYWPDSPNSVNPYLTVYAGFVLTMARKHQYPVPDDLYDKVMAFVKDYADGRGAYEQWFTVSPYYRGLVRNYALMVSSLNGYENLGSLKTAYAELKNTLKDNLPAKAYLLMTASRYKPSESSSTIIKDISDSILSSAQLETSTCYFTGFEDWDWFYYNRTITTALALQALLEANTGFKDSHKVIRWLTLARKNGSWQTTHENALVFWAFDTYLNQYEKEEPNFEATGKINQKEILKTMFTSRKTPVYTQEYPLAAEKSKELSVDLEKNGTGILYYNIRYQYSPVKPVYKREMGFSLDKKTVNYDTGEEVKDNSFIRGKRYIVKLTVFTDKARNFVVMDDQLPGGFEPVNLDFSTEQAESASTHSAVNTEGEEGGWWWWGIFDHREQYRDRVFFTASYLTAGKHEINYVVRAVTAGKYHQPQLKVEEMYNPETFGSLAQPDVTITEQ